MHGHIRWARVLANITVASAHTHGQKENSLIKMCMCTPNAYVCFVGDPFAIAFEVHFTLWSNGAAGMQ